MVVLRASPLLKDLRVSRDTVFYEDREGNLWIGASDGLYRVREMPISVYSKRRASRPTTSIPFTKITCRRIMVWHLGRRRY